MEYFSFLLYRQNMELVGMTFFLSSVFIPLLARVLKTLRLRSITKLRNNEYQLILQSMLAYPPSITVSRHNAVTTEEAFLLRRNFFQSLVGRTSSRSNQVIHIAGTKGKGSSVEYISAGLIGAGKNVGIFSSPHIHTARERIKICRNLISIEDFIRIGKILLEVFRDCQWQYVMFDRMVAAAILYFDEKDVDYIVLETGYQPLFPPFSCKI